MDGPGNVRVTPMNRDTRHRGDIGVSVHGWSRECQGNSNEQGYSDIGGYTCSSVYPRMVQGMSE